MSAGTGAAGPAAIEPLVGTATGGRRRRPSGEPPPLPRVIPPSTYWYAGALALVVALEVALAVQPARVALTGADDAALRAVAATRTDVLTDVALAVEHLGTAPVAKAVAWVTIGLLLLSRRLRRLFAYLAVLLVAVIGSSALATAQGRMRTTAVEVLGPWRGYAHPSAPVAVFAAVVIGAVANLVPPGRYRRRLRIVAGVLVGALCLARLYLGVDRPTDVLAGLVIGGAFSLIAYRLVVPEEVFPVGFRRGRGAHLLITDARRAAILTALEQQLGVHAQSVEPFALGASAGSTPLRIRTADGSSVFGKLYAVNHLRADRSYKIVRMVLYGRLEDEKPYASVRRLVEYEDHVLRLLRDNGLPVPEPLGFVEITPEREYLLVTRFVEGAHELRTEPVQQQQIDEGLRIVRMLWRAGAAHRDIKPSNLLVRDGHLYLIDVAFTTLRPTPWRQAVDLANMMLVLALGSDAEQVYRRAVRQFAPEDVAEAFAACRSVTIPTQLRAALRADPRDLVGTFRRLAPERAPVPIQLWGPRRVVTSVGVLLSAVAAGALVYAYARTAGLL